MTRKPSFQLGNHSTEPGAFAPRYNIAPTQRVLVIRNEAGKFQWATNQWGIPPDWAKPEDLGRRLINIRSETVTGKFRNHLAQKRCLIPADGFYEWRKLGRSRQGVRFTLQSGEPFFFAGLWDDPQEIACAIITTEANSLVSPSHDRMPVILSKEDAPQWLTKESAIDAAELLRPFDAAGMKMDYVGDSVNNVQNDFPRCVTPVPAPPFYDQLDFGSVFGLETPELTN